MKHHATLLVGFLVLLASCTTDASVSTTSSTTDIPATTSTTLSPGTTAPATTTTTTSSQDDLLGYLGPTTIYSRDGSVYLKGTSAEGVAVDLIGAEWVAAEPSGEWWFDLQLAEGTHELTLVGSTAAGARQDVPITVVVNPAFTVEFSFVTEVEAGPDGLMLTADYARFLTGEEANEAARAAGEIGEDETVPNDYYIVNENPRLRELPVSRNAPVSLQACLVDGPCVTELSVTQDAWAALIAGDDPAGLPVGFQWYGGGSLPYWLTLDGDTIVQIVEQYLP